VIYLLKDWLMLHKNRAKIKLKSLVIKKWAMNRKMLNKDFFVRDLHEQLNKLHSGTDKNAKLIVFRGKECKIRNLKE